MITKEIENPYMLSMFEGFDSACAELGAEAIMCGPEDYSAEQQIELIDDLIARKVQVICIAANHADQLDEALGRALGAGIVVVSLDSSVNPQSRMVHVQQADPEKVGRALVQAAEKMVNGAGKAAIISSTPYATNQNEWLEWMLVEYEEGNATISPAGASGFELAGVYYGEDTIDRTWEVMDEILAEHTDLDIVITPSVVSMMAVGQYIEAHKLGLVFTGLGMPSEIADYIANGSCPWMYLWNPIDLGYLTAYASKALLDGKISAKVGDTFDSGRLGLRAVTESADGGTEILLGNPLKFDKSNIDQWKTVY
jgi:rhamnose transport system substrate-binding protein